MSDDREGQDQRIRERAYALWEQEGRQHGSPEDHWHRARREIEQDDEKSGSLDDQLADTFPASDPPGLTDPSGATAAFPAAPEDEASPALSATLEETPGEPALAKPSPRARAAKPATPKAANEKTGGGKQAAPKAEPAKPAAKPRKKPVG